MVNMLEKTVCGALIAGMLAGCSMHKVPARTEHERELAGQISRDRTLDAELSRAKGLLKNGFNAGATYPEVWIRDFATFMTLSCEVNDHAAIRSALLMLARFQREDGNVPDGIAKVKNPVTAPLTVHATTKPGLTMKPVLATTMSLARETIVNSAEPGWRAFKNSVETDQETSFVQAVSLYIRATGDRSILDERIDGAGGPLTLRERLEWGMRFLLDKRWSQPHGLIWGGTTIDWGDIAPEDRIGAVVYPYTHKAIDVYDNAMFLLAVDELVTFFPEDRAKVDYWEAAAKGVRTNVRKWLWDDTRAKFRTHVYLDSSPFPAAFDEDSIYYFGGTAVAIQARVLSRAETLRAYGQLKKKQAEAGAKTLGITNYPVYPKGLFANAHVDPWVYQNGGDWDWFGARMVQALVERGLVREGYGELRPILERLERHAGFYEWFDRDDAPKGSKTFKGSAGQVGNAILVLRQWAKDGSVRGGVR